MLFNSRQKIESPEDVDEMELEPTGFGEVLENHFTNIERDDDHRSIKGEDYTIDYFDDGEPSSNMMLSLYGENGLHELVALARIHGWQIFDTGLGQMIDLENPSANGYENFQKYLEHVLKSKD